MLNDTKKTKGYLKCLHKYNKNTGFYTSAQELLTNYNEFHSIPEKVFYETTICATAPILVSYVFWILKNAINNKIERLYFLARDGQILYKIAVECCNKYGLDLDCRYLYCSRMSLRMPIYIIDKKEAMDFMIINGLNITTDIVLERAGIRENEKLIILKELGIEKSESMKQLSRAGLFKLRSKLESCEIFDSYAKKHAEEALNTVNRYLIQEGMTEDISFALVDSGWVGSMQKTLRILLQRLKKNIKLQGFYFGIFGRQNPQNGDYHTFYFSRNHGMNNAILFNNNLFECLCAADHGMTMCYELNNGKIVPVLNQYVKEKYIEIQQKICMEFIKNYQFNFYDIKEAELKIYIHKLITRFMVKPSKEELLTFGEITICDDVTEKYMIKLARDFRWKDYMYHLIIFKLYYRVIYKGSKQDFRESFWMWGTIQKIPSGIRLIFEINNYVWQMILWFRNNM